MKNILEMSYCYYYKKYIDNNELHRVYNNYNRFNNKKYIEIITLVSYNPTYPKNVQCVRYRA
jgi:hypothetical protein